MAIYNKFSYEFGLLKPATNATNATNVAEPAVDKAQAVPQKRYNVANVANVAAANANVIYLDEYRQKRAR